MKKILIIEHDPEVFQSMARPLITAGYVALEARSLEQGLEAAVSGSPQLIIADLSLPETDGLAILRSLKMERKTAVVPVMFIAERESARDLMKGLGVESFLFKPFADHELLAETARLMSQAPILDPGQLPFQPRKRLRTLIAGSDQDTVSRIDVLSRQLGCPTELAFSGSELISKTVTFHPQLLIVQLQIAGGTPAADLVRTLRMMPEAADIPIIVYNFYEVSELGSTGLDDLAKENEQARRDCLAAGITKYVGMFKERMIRQLLEGYLS